MLDQEVASKFDRVCTTKEEVNPIFHRVIDGLHDRDLLRRAGAAFPSPDWPFWERFESSFDRRWTCGKIEKMPDAVRELLYPLNTSKFADELARLTHIGPLHPDPMLYGAGMHMSGRNDKLDIHLDYSHNPNGLERRISMIVFLTPDWRSEWNGAMEFWASDLRGPAAKYEPEFNRTIIWENGANAYHGFPDELRCPEGAYRKTLVLYYLAQPRPGIIAKPQAEFVKTWLPG